MAYNFNTFGDVINETYNELGLNGTTVSIAGLERSAIEKWANRYSKWFLQKTRLKTAEAVTGFRSLPDETLGADAAQGATSITLTLGIDASEWPTSGYILLDGIPLQYTNLAGTTMTLAATSALPKAFTAGDKVQPGYGVPEDFGKAIRLHVGSTPYFLQKWGLGIRIAGGHYGIYGDYIFLPYMSSGGQDITLSYYQKAQNVLESADNMQIMEVWDAYVIYKGAARGYRMMDDKEQRDDYEAQAEEVLRMAKGMVGDDDASPDRGFATAI